MVQHEVTQSDSGIPGLLLQLHLEVGVQDPPPPTAPAPEASAEILTQGRDPLSGLGVFKEMLTVSLFPESDTIEVFVL